MDSLILSEGFVYMDANGEYIKVNGDGGWTYTGMLSNASVFEKRPVDLQNINLLELPVRLSTKVTIQI